MVDDVAVRLHVVAVLGIDLEPVANADDRLLDRCRATPVQLDLGAHGQLLVLDLRHRVAVRVLQHERLTRADHLAVHPVGPMPAIVFDPVVIADAINFCFRCTADTLARASDDRRIGLPGTAVGSLARPARSSSDVGVLTW